jgi:hypothetical protein
MLLKTVNGLRHNIMKHTLGTAAKACGVGRTTILRAIKSGKISAGKDANGNYAIEPAELHRVYPTVAEKQVLKQQMDCDATPSGMAETAALLAKIAGLEALLSREQESVNDFRHRLNQSEAERRETQGKLTALLTYQPKPEAPSEPQGKNTLWEKIFRKVKQ